VPAGHSQGLGRRGAKKPATPENAALMALSWFASWRAVVPAKWVSDPPPKKPNPVAGGWVMKRENARNRSTRRSGGLPAMIAALIAPIEMPAVQSGCRSASANAS
jgi:hypothetical protein